MGGPNSDDWIEGLALCILSGLGGPVERFTTLAARVRAKREAFCFWTIFYFGGCSEAAMGGGGARSAPFGVAMSSKRRLRAAHGRARAAKTH